MRLSVLIASFVLVTGLARAQSTEPPLEPEPGATEDVPPDDVPPPPAEPESTESTESGDSAASEAAVVHASLDEGFGIRSVDNRFAMRFGLLFAVRGWVEDPEGADPDVRGNLRLGRLAILGHLGDSFQYFTQLEMAGGPHLLDLELTFIARPELGLRVGRFRTPHSREFIMPLTDLQLVARSVVSDYFRADRDTGVSVEGRAWGERIEYRAGVYNEDLDSSPLVLGRLAFDPLGPMAYSETTARAEGPARLSVGASGYWSERQGTRPTVDPMGTIVDAPTPPVERSALGFDLAGRVGPVGFLAEAHLDRREIAGLVSHGAGAFAQAGVFVMPGLVELAVRYDWLTPDRDTSHRGMQRAEVGATLYLFDAHLKAQLRYQFTDVADPVATALAGTARTGHLVDLQLLMAI